MPGKTLKSCPLENPGQVTFYGRWYICCADSKADRPYLAIGLEGSANKLGVGVIKHNQDGSAAVLSNIRHTYITPPGEGFQPRDTAIHHREWILSVIKDATRKAGISIHDVDCICYTKGHSLLSEVNLTSRLIFQHQVREWVRHCSL